MVSGLHDLADLKPDVLLASLLVRRLAVVVSGRLFELD